MHLPSVKIHTMSLESTYECVADSPRDPPLDQRPQEIGSLTSTPTIRVTDFVRLPIERPDPFSNILIEHVGSSNVSRERNRISKAEAAPSNSLQTTSRPKQHSRQLEKKAARQNTSNDEEDDIDHAFDRHDDGPGKDPDQPSRRTLQSPEDEVMHDGSSASLARKETGRVGHLKMLNKAVSHLKSKLYHYKSNKYFGGRRVQRLMERYGKDRNLQTTPAINT